MVKQTAIDLTLQDLILPMAIIGVGLGLFTGQLVDLTMSAVSESQSDISSGVINSLSQLGYAFGTTVAGSVLLSGAYRDIVDGVVQLSGEAAVSSADQRQLAVQLEDAVETTTEAQQEAFVSGLSPEVQQQVLEIIESAMVTAQETVLLLLLLFVLVTLIMASFLPTTKPRKGETEDPTPVAHDEERATGN